MFSQVTQILTCAKRSQYLSTMNLVILVPKAIMEKADDGYFHLDILCCLWHFLPNQNIFQGAAH